jgi:heterodisulfide reductase subunit A
MAVSKSKLLEPLDKKYLPIIQKGLVIGGGLAGMTAALGLAEQGYETYLIEKKSELGGNMKHIHYTLASCDNGSSFESSRSPQEYLKELMEKVSSNEKIKVYTDSKIKLINGFMGNFRTIVETGGKEEELSHGAIIVATGAYEYKPEEYLYGESDKVITQVELEQKLVNDGIDANDIVMIQCVGSRDSEHKWCSRICCNVAMKNALKLKEQNPYVRIYVLYKDIRTYGFKEDFYRKASELGVIFIRYDDERKPQVTNDCGNLMVTVREPVTGEDVEIKPDCVVLSAGTHPNEDNEEIAQTLKVPLNKYNFFLEAHMKLRPVDFATEGVYLCGMAHGPKTIDESISQAYGAVARAVTVLSHDELEAEGIIAKVNENVCDGCGICEAICEYDAIEIIVHPLNREKNLARINEALCKGCGACAMACPSGAVQQLGFRPKQITEMVTAALEAALE